MYSEITITGTDIWYYFICPRESWLNLHKISPDEDDENLEIGRFIHEYRYGRQKKEIPIDSIRLDSIKREDGFWVVKEVKKSSKFLLSSHYQLLYYLYTLKQKGIEVKGELLFPEEKRREKVELNEKTIVDLQKAIEDIRKIAQLPIPPKPKKIHFCRNCAYREYCWAEDSI